MILLFKWFNNLQHGCAVKKVDVLQGLNGWVAFIKNFVNAQKGA